MGRYIPQLRFLDVLLGTEPVLKPEEQFYQRMLAGNPEEGEDLAKPFLADHRLLVFYDEVVLPTLRLAERDRRRGALTRERRAILSDSFLAVVSELEDYENPETQDTAYDFAESPWSGVPILCIAGRTSLDRCRGDLGAALGTARHSGACLAGRSADARGNREIRRGRRQCRLSFVSEHDGGTPRPSSEPTVPPPPAAR
jgi:hypothetical protein